jgi:hypothetical protein
VPGGIDTGTEAFDLRGCIDDQPASDDGVPLAMAATYSARTRADPQAGFAEA